jgi:uncharacterized protein YqjF (DUF2071 family)
VPIDALRRRIPPPLEIDDFHGTAWVGITPFQVRDSRPAILPPLPWEASFLEVDLRTYVHLDGIPGVWLFSLDASDAAAALVGRTFFHLPCHVARIAMERGNDTVRCAMLRKNQIPLGFSATWRVRHDQTHAEPGTLEFFLMERYCLYSAESGRLYRSRFHHEPWLLQSGELMVYEANLFDGVPMPAPGGKPRVRCGGRVDVELWAPEEVS